MFDQFGNSTRKKSTKWCIQKRIITATLECGKSHITGKAPERKIKIQYAYFSDSPDFRSMRSRFKKGNRNQGRTASYPTAPSQIPACGTTAPGSSNLLTYALTIRYSPQ